MKVCKKNTLILKLILLNILFINSISALDSKSLTTLPIKKTNNTKNIVLAVSAGILIVSAAFLAYRFFTARRSPDFKRNNEKRIIRDFLKNTKHIERLEKNHEDDILLYYCLHAKSNIIRLLLEYGFGQDMLRIDKMYNRRDYYGPLLNKETSKYINWAAYFDASEDKPKYIDELDDGEEIKEFLSNRLLNKYHMLYYKSKEDNKMQIQNTFMNNDFY